MTERELFAKAVKDISEHCNRCIYRMEPDKKHLCRICIDVLGGKLIFIFFRENGVLTILEEQQTGE